MPGTRQDAAVQAAIELSQIMTNLRGVREAARSFSDKYNSEQYAQTWAAMPTSEQNPDGSLGAADEQPNTAHPITVGGINRSHDHLVSGVVVLLDFIGFCSNADLAPSQRSQSIDDLAS